MIRVFALAAALALVGCPSEGPTPLEIMREPDPWTDIGNNVSCRTTTIGERVFAICTTRRGVALSEIKP